MKKYLGKTLTGKVASLHMGNNEDLSKKPCASLQAEIGGFAGDKHQGPVRETWEGNGNPQAQYAATNVSGLPFQLKNWLTSPNALS